MSIPSSSGIITATYNPSASTSPAGTPLDVVDSSLGADGPVVHGFTSNVNSSGFTVALTIPTGTVTGDVLTAIVPTQSVSQSVTAPASPSWTAVDTDYATGNGGIGIFTHTYTGTEGWTPGTTTVTFTCGSSGNHFMPAFLIAVGNTNGVDVHETETNLSFGTIALSALDTTVNNDLVLALWSDQAPSGGVPGAITLPTSATQLGSQINSSAGATQTNIGSALGYLNVPVAGSTGSLNASGAASDTACAAAAIAFKPKYTVVQWGIPQAGWEFLLQNPFTDDTGLSTVVIGDYTLNQLTVNLPLGTVALSAGFYGMIDINGNPQALVGSTPASQSDNNIVGSAWQFTWVSFTAATGNQDDFYLYVQYATGEGEPIVD